MSEYVASYVRALNEADAKDIARRMAERDGYRVVAYGRVVHIRPGLYGVTLDVVPR